MADNLKDVGKGDRIRASQQKHEIRFIVDKFNIAWQAALGAIKAAGLRRDEMYANRHARQPKLDLGAP